MPMGLFEVLDHVREKSQRRGRITYRMLQAQFKLNEGDLEALKAEFRAQCTGVVRIGAGKRKAWPNCRLSRAPSRQMGESQISEVSNQRLADMRSGESGGDTWAPPTV